MSDLIKTFEGKEFFREESESDSFVEREEEDFNFFVVVVVLHILFVDSLFCFLFLKRILWF